MSTQDANAKEIDVETALRYMRDRIAFLKATYYAETCAFQKSLYEQSAHDLSQHLRSRYILWGYSDTGAATDKDDANAGIGWRWLCPLVAIIVTLVVVLQLWRNIRRSVHTYWHLQRRRAQLKEVDFIKRFQQRTRLSESAFRRSRAQITFLAIVCTLLTIPLLLAMCYSSVLMDVALQQTLKTLLPAPVVAWVSTAFGSDGVVSRTVGYFTRRGGSRDGFGSEDDLSDDFMVGGGYSSPPRRQQQSSQRVRRVMDLYFWYYVGPPLLFAMMYLLKCATDSMRAVVLKSDGTGGYSSDGAGSRLLEYLHKERKRRRELEEQQRHVELMTALAAGTSTLALSPKSPAALLIQQQQQQRESIAKYEGCKRALAATPSQLCFTEDDEEGSAAADTTEPCEPTPEKQDA